VADVGGRGNGPVRRRGPVAPWRGADARARPHHAGDPPGLAAHQSGRDAGRLREPDAHALSRDTARGRGRHG
jgi:hypothetical protein